ncbi:flippase [Patescibacteria group bacterium]|nr:flippase [Patescibacteria group bacterium]
MTLARKVAHNTMIQFAGKALGTVLALVTIGFMTRYLGQKGFGEYTTIIAFLSVFATMADLGLYMVVTREISKDGADEKKIVSNALAIKLTAAIGILIITPFIALLFPYSHTVVFGIAIGAFSFLFILLNQTLIGIFQKHFRMDKVALAEIAGRVIWLLGVLLTIKFGWGLLVMISFVALSNFVNFLIIFIAARRFVKVGLQFDFAFWKKLMIIAAPLALSVVFTLIHFKVDTIFLSILKPAEDVGIYGAAYKILEGLITFAAIFSGILMPIMSRNAFKDREKFAKVYRKGFDIISIMVIPLVVGVLLFAKPIIIFISGENFSASGPILQILILAVGAIFFAHLFGGAIVALNQQKKMMWAYLFAAVIAIILNLLLIPKFTYYGAAWTTFITETLVAIITVTAVYKVSKIAPQLKVFGKATLAAGVMALVAFCLPNWHVLISIAIVTVVYFVCLFLFRGFSKEMVLEMLRWKKESGSEPTSLNE